MVAYNLERGGMPLYDAVGINCGKGATTKKSRLMCLVYGLRCMLDYGACVI